MQLASGTVIDQRYEVHEAIGTGGQAVVYRVRHRQLDAWHAMKVVTRAHGDAVQRILREGRLQASLRHPHVVRVTDVVTCNDAPALIMDFVDGPDLANVLERGPLTIDHVDQIGQAVLSALGAAHARGLVHRDLKPENILLARSDDGHIVPMVTDFGIAVHIQVDRRTPTGAVIGTPNYMSPEQIRDGKRVDARSDIWALGTVLYELLSRRVAFSGDSVYKVWEAVQQAQPVPLRSLVPDVPERMLRAIEGALIRDPAARHQSCEQMLEIWAGQPVKSTSPRRFTLDLDDVTWRQPSSAADRYVKTEPQPLALSTIVPTVTPQTALVAGVVATITGVLLILGVGLGAAAMLALQERSARATSVDGAGETVVVPPASELLPEPGASPEPTPVTRPGPLAPPDEGPPEPAPMPTGEVLVTGAVVRLKHAGEVHRAPGQLPPGDYEVWVDFGDGEFRYPRRLTVRPDVAVRVVCNPGTQLCQY
ncbi:MAG: protein kinase [Myxococcota bacterium]